MRALTIDIGSSSVRSAVVDEIGTVSHVLQRPLTVRSPEPGEVELDPSEIANVALELGAAALRDAGACDVVGVTNQRATTIVFDPRTGTSVGPALSWQDLRTVIDCLVLQASGIRLAPNQSATKVKWLVEQSSRPAHELRFATIETWIAWHLTKGAAYVSDHSNASVSGLVDVDLGWDSATLHALGVSEIGLPQLVDTMGFYGEASALAGAPAITALIGDQPASLFGQSCVRSGAKITFGTGAMLDMVHRADAPQSLSRYASGCYPTVVRSDATGVTWGVEGIILSAGSCVQWLVELGLLDDVAESEALATSVTSSDGVSFVPAFSGLGTPRWDFGARGAFFGLTRGSSRAHLARAVLDGIAHRGADLLDAAEAEVGIELPQLRVDGGMSTNRYVMQRLADFSGREVAVSSEREATTRGAGLMALVSAGHLHVDDVEQLWSPGAVLAPSLSDRDRLNARGEWAAIVERAARTIPELSDVAF
ncbi:MAG TPA: FGGY family carbohydrate kinase [Acidimicrobiales bacterium]|nr:FGGY family carbohydrate kinase [Acidimicrobiales bacterium]